MAKKRSLGRGLGALIKEAAPATTPTTLPLERLKPNRLQPRNAFDSQSLAELAESIRAQGVVQPIVVTPRSGGDYTIVAGERRWRAAGQAGLAEVPVVVRRVESDRDLLEMALVENLQRADLNPVEEAEAYKRLADEFGLKQDDIGRRVGKSRSQVANTLRLLGLPAEVLEYLRQGQLTAGQARPLLSLSGPNEQIRMARKATRSGLSARELETAARRSKRGQAEVDADTQAAADDLSRKLGTKVEIRRRGKGGRVSILFHSEEELIRLHETLMNAGR